MESKSTKEKKPHAITDDLKLPKINSEASISRKIVVIDGNCISKNEITHLKKYFDKLSDNESKLTIKSFLLT